ncbi:D-alanine-D-alanine ligase [Nocardioides scoriae]|uniref:D-alanine-D-alanine ligase n=1 Tax=Nocardioides scoriae TaxID=642780 RepID=A0A1H1V615_9ACTN|nr:D-alanine--D-alanine ligase [Nocardioides scoriae]SDS79729.1 D-alanine-D-alanine ligase [Nocardioides scoriae]
MAGSTGPGATGRPLRVLHLVGSAESDFLAELSRLYAADCLAATADPAYDVTVAVVSPDGSWRFPTGLGPDELAAAAPVDVAAAIGRLRELAPDVAVPQMFCLPGMTTHRSLLDLLGIPFVGNRADVMALAAHKARAKAVVAAAGVRVPAGQLLRPGDVASVPLPVVVKPVDADNSMGVALVREPDALDAAVAAAFEHSGEVLVEEYVELGREVRCGVLEVDGELVALPLEEYAVDRETKPVRGYDDKLRRDDADGSGDGALALVAKEAAYAWIVDVADPLTARVQEAAKACHRALGCRDYSLFDFRVDADGEPWFLEAGLYCSYASTSVVAVMAGAAGTSLPALFRQGVHQALARGVR